MFYKGPVETTEHLVYQFLSYDTRSNFASTNPLWQIYYNTYSRNNPTSIHHFTGKKIPLSTGGYIDEFIDVKVKYTYGANFGTLPTEVEFNDANTGLPFYPQVPVATIKYQCQSILTPGN
jgi:hypothetical protein